MVRVNSLTTAACLMVTLGLWHLPAAYTSSSFNGSAIPSSCYSPSGGDCGWYRDCLEHKIPCSGQTGDYAIAYADKYCNRFQDNYNRFSTEGKQWVDSVRKCLQVKLVPVLSRSPLPACSAIQSEAFSSHVPCYVQADPSYCDLSDSDKAVIEDTVKEAMLPGTTLQDYMRTLGHCLLQD